LLSNGDYSSPDKLAGVKGVQEIQQWDMRLTSPVPRVASTNENKGNPDAAEGFGIGKDSSEDSSSPCER
jgi:hypothetical protein